MGVRALLPLVLLVVVSVVGRSDAAQDPAKPVQRTIWDGVFSTKQAANGSVVFETHCSRCHTEEQRLSGDTFMLNWEGHNLALLFRKIRETMPPDGIDRVTEEEKLAAMAFVLAQNGFPASAIDLTGDPGVLAGIDILPREGRQPLRSGAFVEVTGCLREAPKEWILDNATEPVATVLEKGSSGNQSPPATFPRGNQTFRLLDAYPSPVAHKGHPMRVKGLLIRDPTGDRINVVSLEMLGSQCPPE
jgi:hypothetical protein